MNKLFRAVLSATVALMISFPTWADDPAPAIPETPAAIDTVVYAQQFTLERGYPFEWRRDNTRLTEGTILVLRVAPALAYQRQSYNPVLYVDNTTAERINHGYRSGFIVVVVPKAVDPADAPIWFGAPDVLPEQVTGAKIAAERSLAEASGIVAQPAALWGESLNLKDRDALQAVLAQLVSRYSADEQDLIARLNAVGNPE